MNMAITCSKCGQRFAPDDIISKVAYKDDIRYYHWACTKDFADKLRDGGRLEFAQAGTFQAEIDIGLNRPVEAKYIPQPRSYVYSRTCPCGAKFQTTDSSRVYCSATCENKHPLMDVPNPEREILDIVREHEGLTGQDIIKLQTNNKSSSSVYKRLKHMVRNGYLQKRNTRYYINEV